MRRIVLASPMATNTPSLIIKIFVVAALVFSLIPIGLAAAPDSAYASESAYLSVGSQIPYAGWGTKHYSVNGNEAYCGDPSSPSPSEGTYRMEEITNTPLLAGLWYGYGGPGFDASMWPSTWYDGSAMTANRYRVLTHIVLADIYSHDGEYSYGQCNDDFIKWCQDNVVGYSFSSGKVVNENALAVRINKSGFNLNGDGDSYGDVPAGFKGYLMNTGEETQIILTFDYNPYGSLEVQKTSSNTDITDGNGCYTLEGAVFGIYSDEDCTKLVRSITTDAEGVAHADDLLVGTYYVKELTPPAGFSLSYETHEVTIEAEQTAHDEMSNFPQHDPAYLCVQKYDGEQAFFAHNLPQGSASLSGAEYRLDYYDGYYSTLADAESSGSPTRSWTLRTDDDGFAALDQSYLVSGDALYEDTHGNPTLPLGTVVIRETKAPEGYVLDEATTYVQQITAEGHLETVYTYVAPVHPEQVIRGGVSIEKRDLESGLLTPLGGASLDGTEFQIVNRSERSVFVDGIEYAPNAVVKTIYSVGGTASTPSDCLPYGTYSIKETAPGTGYLLTDAKERYFDIANDGEVVKLTGDNAPHNQVKRGDVELVKVRESDQRRLGGIPFRITSDTTGEAHVFVTDDNGEAKTGASWNPHTQRTNANDGAVLDDGTVNESKLDSEAGVWFGLTSEGRTVAADDTLGALPCDTYQIDELPCSQNEGLELVSLKLRVSRHSYQVDLGSVDDQTKGQVTLSTTARDGHDGDKEIAPDPEATIIDRVEYAGLTVGNTYTVQGTLVDKTTGEPVLNESGGNVVATKTFKATSASGYIELEFSLDTTMAAGHKIVAFETLVDATTGAVVAEHTDIEDFDQTVSVGTPRIGTTATDGLDGDHAIIADGAAKVVDTVSYSGLMAGKEYLAEGTLMVVTEGEASPLLLSDGSPVTAAVSFVPESSDGSIEVVFEFDASLLVGAKLVAYEKVLRSGAVIADHEDPDDPSQTVEVKAPEIGTFAFDGIDDDKSVVADPSSKIVDRIAYQNLVPGREYLAFGIVLDKATELPAATSDSSGAEDTAELIKKALGYEVAGTEDSTPTLPREVDGADLEKVFAALQNQGGLVWGKQEFVPESQSGSIEVAFELDSRALSGKSFVVVEFLLVEDGGELILVADHADPDSEDQSFEIVPSAIGTLARDKSDGDHSVLACKDAVIVDTVSYSNLIPGLEYELSGVLMDKSTGKELMVGDQPVRASVLFTPNAPDGEVEVEFALDTTSIENRDIVVFEYLTKDDVLVAEHADIDDQAQSVHVTDVELTRTITGFYDKTGLDQRGLIAVIALLLGGGSVALVYGIRRFAADRTDEEQEGVGEDTDPEGLGN